MKLLKKHCLGAEVKHRQQEDIEADLQHEAAELRGDDGAEPAVDAEERCGHEHRRARGHGQGGDPHQRGVLLAAKDIARRERRGGKHDHGRGDI